MDDNYIKVRQATKQGYAELEPCGVADLNYPQSETRRGRVQDRGKICPTLTASSNVPCRIEQVGQLYGTQKEPNPQAGRVYSIEGIAPTMDTCSGGNRMPKVVENYRIRKLTPCECWRLMGFADADFAKAQAVNSDSQLYKQAGNSIVVQVLEGILRNLLEDR